MPYYAAALLIFIILRFWFTTAGNNDLGFLLYPTDKLTGLLTGSNSVYHSDFGFYHEKLNIALDKSCSGFNYWILCFLVFTYLLVKYPQKPLYKLLAVPASLGCAWLLTIFVNSSRIFVSLIEQSQTLTVFPNHQHLVHQTIGIITNLSFLVLVFCLLERLLSNRKKNEKYS